MFTICWNNHEFEYLQDQTTCPKCGEYGQHQQTRRFALGELEEIKKRMQDAFDRNKEGFAYSRGYQEGFEAGMLAERKRVEEST